MIALITNHKPALPNHDISGMGLVDSEYLKQYLGHGQSSGLVEQILTSDPY